MDFEARRKQVDVLIGTHLRATARAHGVRLDDLAERLGVTRARLRSYMAGRKRIGAAMLLTAANALGEPVTVFFSERGT